MPEILASFPNGTFLENLEPQPDGSVLFTSYMDRKILRWSEAGVAVFAELPAHPTSLVTLPSGIWVAAHGASFAAGTEFTATMRLLELAPDGTLRRTITAPQARFLNGAIALNSGALLVADSLAGCVWRLDVDTASLSPFVADAALQPRGEGFALGANGIKIAGDWLFVSNTSARTLYRVALSGGVPEVFATFSGIDDFAVAPDGAVYVATHGTEVVRRGADGAIDVLVSEHAEGATAVAFGLGPQQGWLFVTTTGGLFAGFKAEAHLLRVDPGSKAGA
jgi:sugar lactone lactonase YvrE